jgi:hypothetical protein
MTKSPTNLWRGVRVEDFPSGVIIDEDPAEEILYPDFERKQIGKKRNGAPKYREPDVEVVKGIVQTGGGTSLFNKDKFFNGKSWQYFIFLKVTRSIRDLSLPVLNITTTLRQTTIKLKLISSFELIPTKAHWII